MLTILPGGALYSGSTGQVNLNAAGVTLNGGGQVFGQIDVFASTAAAQTTVQGLSIILPGVGNGIELRNASTEVLISDVTLTQGGGPTTNGVVIPTGTSARILASSIQGHNNGVRVAGGKALIQGTNLSNNTPGSNSAGLWVGGQGAVDAGQITTVAFLGFAGAGPLTSNGRNTFNGYSAADQGVINANADGPGPQGVGGPVSDVMAQCNVWNGLDTTTIATPGNFNYTAIEGVVTHDVDQATRGFVNYVKPASASPTLIAVRYYNETDAEPVGQRSMIRLFNFAFDNFVVGVNGGVTVTKVASVFDTRTGSTVYGNLTLVPKGTGFNPQTGQFRHEFSFSRAAGLTESSGSLVDGNYTFSINPSLIRALNNAGPGAAIGGTVPVSFHRLFGDVNGDAKVNAADQAVFNGALRSRRGMASYVSYLDFNLDSFIDTTDGTQFQRRFGLY
ncbi:MAG: dockerin type I domain-containing protein [Gemmataceae bacterium]